jgi:hypothetical protein
LQKVNANFKKSCYIYNKIIKDNDIEKFKIDFEEIKNESDFEDNIEIDFESDIEDESDFEDVENESNFEDDVENEFDLDENIKEVLDFNKNTVE